MKGGNLATKWRPPKSYTQNIRRRGSIFIAISIGSFGTARLRSSRQIEGLELHLNFDGALGHCRLR